MFKIFYLLILSHLLSSILTLDFKRVCYLRPDPEIPLNYIIESQYCTHIIIGFNTVNDNSIEVDDTYGKFYQRCKSAISAMNSETLVMISIGGGGNDNGFHSAALTIDNRKKFANSVLNVLLEYQLDGIDLDWEFPSWGNLHFDDKNNFNLLLKEIRQTFLIYSSNTSRQPFLLSTAVAAQYTVIERSYDVPELVKYVDFINLMTYDYYIYHWYWPFVGHNSPLFARTLDIGLFSTFNIDWSANYWNRLGADKSQIMVGIPTYGRQFRLALRWLTIPGTLVVATSEDMGYSRICQFLQANGTTVVFDPIAQVPYAYRDNLWTTYENEESAKRKVKWIRDNGFGGVMTFSLNADDFRNVCKDNEMFVIHSAIKSALIN